MPKQNVVVIGASAGGIEALQTIARKLPADFAASLFVVVHTAPQSPGILADILDRAGSLTATNAVDGERIKPGRIYVAPPDRHLILEPGVVRVTRGPRENRFRPAVDPLFRSAAQVYGPAAIGVILTGNLDDGTAGLWAIKRLGGTAIAQDPEDALFPSMPESAVRHVEVDYRLPLEEIAPLLARLTSLTAEEEGEFRVPEGIEIEVNIAKETRPLDAGVLNLGVPSTFTCPECHGALLQLKEGERTRFRCHTGHAYTADALLAEISESVEDSLWAAVRTIQESAMLLRHIAAHLQTHGDATEAAQFLERAREADRRAEITRRVTLDGETLSVEKTAET